MIRISRGLLAAAGFAAVCQSIALGATWEHQYEGDVLPNNFVPAFSLQDAGGTGTTTLNAGGWVDVTSNNTAWYQWDLNSTWNVGASGSTIELRLAVPQVNDVFGTSFQVIGGGYVWYFTWSADNVFQNESSQGQLPFNAGQFNTYRMTFQPDGMANVYLNGDPAPRLTGMGSVAGGANFSFGDLGSRVKGTGAYDYIYWTTEGAFAPVPEPSAMLLSLGGVSAMLTMVRRKRRGAP